MFEEITNFESMAENFINEEYNFSLDDTELDWYGE